MIKAIYELDMTPRRTLPAIINVSQYDDIGRTLVFNLFSSSGKWTAPTSAAVTFEGGKPDGKFFAYNCAYSSGTVTVTIQQQMTAVAGKVRCKIKVKSGDKVVESAPIIMVVDAAAVPDGSDMSKSDINDAIANATQKIVDQVKDSIPSDYAQLSTDVSSLKGDLVQLYVTPQIVWQNRKYVNGSDGFVGSVNGYDMAVIHVGDIARIKGELYFNNDAGYAFYDLNKKYIIGDNNSTQSTYLYKANIDVPENAEYMYISHRTGRGFELSISCLKRINKINELYDSVSDVSPALVDGQGILYNNGEFYEAQTYSYCSIDVNNVSHISGTCYFANDFGYALYDAEGKYLTGAKNTTVGSWVYNLDIDIPQNASSIKISHRNDKGYELNLTLTTNGILSDISSTKNHISEVDNRTSDIEKRIVTPKNYPVKIKKESLVELENMKINAPNTKSGNVYTFYAHIDSMSTIFVGHGVSAYASTWLRIRNNIVEVHRQEASDVLVNTYTHGLTFSEFINVVIKTNANNTADVVLSSDSGVYSINGIEWVGSCETVFAKAISGSYSDCELSYYCKDLEKPVWFFGDSYMSQWNVYADEWGAKNWLNDSYPGRNSSEAQAIASLNSDIEKGKPKIIVWAMGMNDQEKVSWGLQQWRNGYDTVRKICDDNEIELVLVTIPNTPKMINTGKNAIIKASGYRYVDIAKLVGATEENATWYEGLLSADNVHPTETGRKLIALKFMSDIPEMI